MRAPNSSRIHSITIRISCQFLLPDQKMAACLYGNVDPERWLAAIRLRSHLVSTRSGDRGLDSSLPVQSRPGPDQASLIQLVSRALFGLP